MLQITALTKSYDAGASLALADVSFNLDEGKSLAVLGPSGCGKSTLLRLIAGLETPDGGEAAMNGESLNGIPPHRRGFGLMHQDLALFPHLNVRDNIAFGLRSQRWEAGQIERRVDELLELMRIAPLAGRSVDAISGGEQQRVALARSLAPRPRLLMLDEPLGALDRRLREELAQEVRHIRDHEGVTLIYVTHDHDEAFAVADDILVLEQGKAVQHGPPEEVWLNPATPFVARFLGHENLFPCELSTREDGTNEARCALGVWRPAEIPATPQCTALIPPEAATLHQPDTHTAANDDPPALSATIVEVTLQGGMYDVTLDVQGETLHARAPITTATTRPHPNTTTQITIDWPQTRLLNWLE